MVESWWLYKKKEKVQSLSGLILYPTLEICWQEDHYQMRPLDLVHLGP